MKKDLAKALCFFAAGIIVGNIASQHINIAAPEAADGYIIRMEGKNINVYRITEDGEFFEKNIENANVFDMPDKLAAEFKKGIFTGDEYGLEKLIEEITS